MQPVLTTSMPMEKSKAFKKGDFTYTLKADGHKTLAEAVGLATGAQDALNKASSSVVHNLVGHSFELKDGKVEKIDLKNGTELTVKAPADFDPNIANLRLMEISKMKFADTPAEFTLTDNPPYGSAQLYEKVAGKFLLKHGNQYKNSVYEDGTHKFTVTGAGADKYTLVKKTKDGSTTVSIEELKGGITKTVDANSVTLSGTESNGNDTITVKDGQTNFSMFGDANDVGIDNLNAGEVSFKSIEKVVVDSGTALKAKGLDPLKFTSTLTFTFCAKSNCRTKKR